MAKSTDFGKLISVLERTDTLLPKRMTKGQCNTTLPNGCTSLVKLTKKRSIYWQNRAAHRCMLNQNQFDLRINGEFPRRGLQPIENRVLMPIPSGV